MYAFARQFVVFIDTFARKSTTGVWKDLKLAIIRISICVQFKMCSATCSIARLSTLVTAVLVLGELIRAIAVHIFKFAVHAKSVQGVHLSRRPADVLGSADGGGGSSGVLSAEQTEIQARLRRR